MDQPSELHTWDMARGTIDALKVPDSFCWLGVDLIEEAASVLLGKDSCEAPGLILQGLHILDVDEKDIASICSFDLEWSGKIVDSGEIYITDVVCTVIVLDLTTCPVYTLNLNRFVVLDGSACRD